MKKNSSTSKSSIKVNNLKELYQIIQSKEPEFFQLDKKSSFQNYGSLVYLLIVTIQIAILIINIGAVMWIHKLEKIKCACSESYMRSYIKYFLYIFILLSIINISINIFIMMFIYTYGINKYMSAMARLADKLADNHDIVTITWILNGMYTIFALGNIVFSIIFIYKLKEMNCECSEDVRREVFWIYNIILASFQAIVIALAILMLIVAVIFSFNDNKK